MLETLSNSNQGLLDKKLCFCSCLCMKEHTLQTNLWALGRSEHTSQSHLEIWKVRTHIQTKLCYLDRSEHTFKPNLVLGAGDSSARQGTATCPQPQLRAQGSLYLTEPHPNKMYNLPLEGWLRKQKENNPQTALTGILSVLLSFQTSKSATTMSLSSVRDKTPSRSTSNTLKQTEGKGNNFAVRTIPQLFFFFIPCSP